MAMSQVSWKTEVDQATDSEWSAMLDQFEDANIYQTAAYGNVRWGESSLSRLVLKRDDEVVALAQFRIIRPTPLKFGMAYLRWGPLWEKKESAPDPEIAIRLAAAIRIEYLHKRKLFLRILPNAFAGSARAALFQSAFQSFAEENGNSAEIYRTFVLDLSPSLEQLRSGLDKKWRNQLTRSEKNNLTMVQGQGTEEFETFCGMYWQMRKRKSFDTRVDVEEFGRMQKILPDSQRMQTLICQENGVPVAGLVASAMGNSAIYLLGATSDGGLNAKGAYLLQWTLICHLKEKGTRWYDLGGIDPEGNPGVYHFKKGISGEDACQISPLSASESAVSSGLVKAGLAMQRTISGSLNALTLMWPSKQSPAGARV
jgi:lipid II:glycine glycyltransferase (peptidoglycan interpeptide bridge formation enzyme)